jgi:hypothetical protein
VSLNISLSSDENCAARHSTTRPPGHTRLPLLRDEVSLRGKQVGNRQALAAVKANAAHRAANLRAIVDELTHSGFHQRARYCRSIERAGHPSRVVARGIQRQPLGYCGGCKRDID